MEEKIGIKNDVGYADVCDWAISVELLSVAGIFHRQLQMFFG